jgi:hypothetical protein
VCEIRNDLPIKCIFFVRSYRQLLPQALFGFELRTVPGIGAKAFLLRPQYWFIDPNVELGGNSERPMTMSPRGAIWGVRVVGERNWSESSSCRRGLFS